VVVMNKVGLGFIVLIILLGDADALSVSTSTPISAPCIPEPIATFDLFPGAGANGVFVTTNISISFSRPTGIWEFKLEPSVEISNITKEPVSLASEKVTFYPAKLLQTNTTYTVTVTYGSGPPIGNINFCPTSNISWNFTTVPAFMKGDVNGDGNVDIVDALFIVQYTVGMKTLSAAQLAAADVNGDGQVTIVDALFIAQYTVGLRQL